MDKIDPLAQISHHLRTPMTVIMSTVDNLLAGAFGCLNEDQTKWLRKLSNHTANLEKLLYETLNMVKAQMEASTALRELEKKTCMPITLNSVPPTDESTIPVTGLRRNDVMPKILAIDDEPDILDVIQEGLKMKGFDTILADNGEEGARLALQAKPDVVLLDVLLKDRNGIDVCREIKSRLSSFTPVIMMTGQNDLREKVSGSHHIADDLLSKPFQIEELFARVRSMLKIKQLTDELDAYRMRESA